MWIFGTGQGYDNIFFSQETQYRYIVYIKITVCHIYSALFISVQVWKTFDETIFFSVGKKPYCVGFQITFTCKTNDKKSFKKYYIVCYKHAIFFFNNYWCSMQAT